MPKLKQLCFLFLCLLILATSISMPIYATQTTQPTEETEVKEEPFNWSFSQETGTLTLTGNGPIPTYRQYGDRPWDAHIENIKKIVVSDGLTLVGGYAFYKHESLEEVQLPEGLHYIGEGAFELCSSLKTVSLPNTVTFIGADAFSGCSLTQLVIPDSVTAISEGAFSSAFEGTPELVIPASVLTIGNNAFADNQFSKISVEQGNTEYYTDADGVLYGKAPSELIKAPTSLSGIYHVAEGTSVICYNAFDGVRNLEELVLPDSLFKIENYAFHRSAIDRMVIPNSVTNLGEGAFFSCSIDQVTLPNNLERIPDSLFLSSYLDSITIPESVTSIGRSAFMYCSLESVKIPNGVTTIEASAFAENKELKSVYIPDSVSQIASSAFCGSSVDLDITVDPENNNYSVSESGILMDKSGKTIVYAPGSISGAYTVAPTVEVIDSSAFAKSPLKILAIPGDNFSIGENAFADSDLEKVYLGEGLTRINGDRFDNPFDGCENLTDIYFGGTGEQWKSVQAEDLRDFPENVTVHLEVSYEAFRKEMKLQKDASSAEFPWWIVIVSAAVVVPGLYLWLAYRRKTSEEGM